MASRFNIPTPVGTPVRVYRNLHPTKPTWSIQARVRQPGTNRHHWKVVGWSNDLLLARCTTRVYEAGRRRVLATKTKNVHSYILGTLISTETWALPLAVPEGGYRVKYSPYKYGYFYSPDFDDRRVDGGEVFFLTEEGEVWGAPAGIVLDGLDAEVELKRLWEVARG
jgi:hypothetical protein